MSDNDINAASNPYAAPQSAMEDVVTDARLATRWERLFAAIIDALVQGVVALVPMIIFFGGWANYIGAVTGAPFLFKVGNTVLGFVVYLVINGYFLSRDGQTVGKKAMSIKIVRTDGSNADFVRIVGYRQAPIWLVQIIPYLGSFVCLIDVLMIFRDTRRCLHDDIADTKVVKVG
jgi:uncharacterized RDD family membrane protein YckC